MNDREVMLQAIEEAKKAYAIGEIPVGCIIVYNDEIIAKTHNETRTRDCNLYHAEILAIEEASKKIGRYNLQDASIYVTLEPCLMCCGAIIQSRIKRLIFGVNEERFGACESIMNTFDMKSNHKVMVTKGICEEEIEKMMKEFFIDLRQSKCEDRR